MSGRHYCLSLTNHLVNCFPFQFWECQDSNLESAHRAVRVGTAASIGAAIVAQQSSRSNRRAAIVAQQTPWRDRRCAESSAPSLSAIVGAQQAIVGAQQAIVGGARQIQRSSVLNKRSSMRYAASVVDAIFARDRRYAISYGLCSDRPRGKRQQVSAQQMWVRNKRSSMRSMSRRRGRRRLSPRPSLETFVRSDASCWAFAATSHHIV